MRERDREGERKRTKKKKNKTKYISNKKNNEIIQQATFATSFVCTQKQSATAARSIKLTPHTHTQEWHDATTTTQTSEKYILYCLYHHLFFLFQVIVYDSFSKCNRQKVITLWMQRKEVVVLECFFYVFHCLPFLLV